MLEQIRMKIIRLKEAKAWLQNHLNADEVTFKQLFADVMELINEKNHEEKPIQLVKEGPNSSFVNFE